MLLRLLISAAILTVPFGILALLSGKADGLIWLMIPFIGLVPVFLVAAVLVFIPIEKLAAAFHWSPVSALMVAGGLIGTLIAFLAAYFGKKRATIIADFASGDLTVIGSIIGIVVLGIAMGAVWHLSRRVIEHWGAA
jgi:hypothetical protein